ncbi:hypothetical protein CWI35_02980 [[Bacillus] caldolyticus]|uniref:Uncharacterized protein n=1 Tax=Bacillus caldolyticus TaxID=1394 RepID=A0ABM6QJK0_BACCL|nr:hypothetical protein CWI35_02980 [[Bacillus] caldolyticus]
MGGTPNGLKQFFVQGRTTIKKHVFPNCLRSSSIMEGEIDFHAWVGSKIYSWMFIMYIGMKQYVVFGLRKNTLLGQPFFI